MASAVKIEQREANQQKPQDKITKKNTAKVRQAKQITKNDAKKIPKVAQKSSAKAQGAKNVEKIKGVTAVSSQIPEALSVSNMIDVPSVKSKAMATEISNQSPAVSSPLPTQSDLVKTCTDALATDDCPSSKQPYLTHSSFRINMAAVMLLSYGLTGTASTVAIFALLLNGSLSTIPVFGTIIIGLGNDIGYVVVPIFALSIVSVFAALRLLLPNSAFLRTKH